MKMVIAPPTSHDFSDQFPRHLQKVRHPRGRRHGGLGSQLWDMNPH
jgi:hypothetical protein